MPDNPSPHFLNLMMNYRDKNLETEFLAEPEVRAHPWTTALTDESHRYYNFIENPELISTSLEDFLPFDKYQAVQTFYEMLRWLNGKDSIFESNDSALLKGLEINADRNTPKIARQPYRIKGRLFFFFREHILNGDKTAFSWLLNDLRKEFDNVAPKFDLGIVGYALSPTAYLSLPSPLSETNFPSVCLAFFAWGSDEKDTMENLRKVFANTFVVLKKLSKKGIDRKFPQRGRLLLQKVLENDAETINKLTTVREI